MLQRLSEKPARSISELAREFGISNTAASDQVNILEQAQLVTRSQRGKYNQVMLAPERTLETLLAIASQFS